MATLICDVVVLYLMKNGDFYKKKKYLEVKATDAFAVRRPLVNDSAENDDDRQSRLSEDLD